MFMHLLSENAYAFADPVPIPDFDIRRTLVMDPRQQSEMHGPEPGAWAGGLPRPWSEAV